MKHLSGPGDLALFGGTPAFAEPLHVGRPNVPDRAGFMRRVEDILDRRWFSNNGPVVREFEQRVAEYLGVEHCVAMCNGTTALQNAIAALDLSGEVIVPSFTFVATAHALQTQGITPVFADIDIESCTLDPRSVERAITPHTSAVIGVHVWGRGCDVAGLEAVCRRHGLALLFDAAHALGCSHHGRMIGNFGRCEVLSFHATKFLSTFEGGAVVTNDGALANRLRLMRNFGFQGADNVVRLGDNGKMPEVCAAMGLAGLSAVGETIEANRRNYDAYRSHLSGIPGLRVLTYAESERSNYQYVVVEVDDTYPVSRDDLVRLLHPENLLVRRYFHPGCHQMEPYRTLFPNAGALLPNTLHVSSRVLSMPTGTAIGPREIRQVAALLRFIAEHGREIREASMSLSTGAVGRFETEALRRAV
jgi:dTDP-4-amino-4,6-dideoxygalactose transaminase